MDSPSPEPSVFLDTSPLTKRSVISSALKFSSAAETFFIRTDTLSCSSFTSINTRVLGRAYLEMLTIRFSKIRYAFSLSSSTITFSSGTSHFTSSPAAFKFLSYSSSNLLQKSYDIQFHKVAMSHLWLVAVADLKQILNEHFQALRFLLQYPDIFLSLLFYLFHFSEDPHK